MRIGFIGLGKMGSGIAKNLIAGGHAVSVFNRSRAPVDELARAGAKPCDTVSGAAAEAEILISMLADDTVTEKLVLGEALAALPKGTIHIAMSTLSPAFADRLTQAHAEAGQGYLSAPVFGRPSAAAEKKIFVVMAGRTEWIARARPVLDSTCQGIFVAGGRPSTANTVKLAGNFLIASALESMAEAFALVRKGGIEPAQFLEIANGALFKSPLYASYGRMMAEGKSEPAGFALKLGLKDVRLVQATSDRLETPMPIASLLHDLFLTAAARGHGEKDWSYLGAQAAENAGLTT